MSERIVSVERVIQADASTIFDIVSDPLMHSVMDGSGTVQGTMKGPRRLVMGSTFGMKMSTGPVPYVIRNTVVEFEADRRIAWRHLMRHRWRYELEPQAGGGTLVRESCDWSTTPLALFIEKAGFPKMYPKAITRTLENLDRMACERQAELDGDVTG